MKPHFELSKLQSTDPIKLSSATVLYEPVRGSSSGSRYFCVGVNTFYKMAGDHRDRDRFAGADGNPRLAGGEIRRALSRGNPPRSGRPAARWSKRSRSILAGRPA